MSSTFKSASIKVAAANAFSGTKATEPAKKIKFKADTSVRKFLIRTLSKEEFEQFCTYSGQSYPRHNL